MLWGSRHRLALEDLKRVQEAILGPRHSCMSGSLSSSSEVSDYLRITYGFELTPPPTASTPIRFTMAGPGSATQDRLASRIGYPNGSSRYGGLAARTVDTLPYGDPAPERVHLRTPSDSDHQSHMSLSQSPAPGVAVESTPSSTTRARTLSGSTGGSPNPGNVSNLQAFASNLNVGGDLVQPYQLEKYRADLQQQHQSLSARLELEEDDIKQEEKKIKKRKIVFHANKIRKKRCEEKLALVAEGLEAITKYQKVSSMYHADASDGSRANQAVEGDADDIMSDFDVLDRSSSAAENGI
ncbi:hypothetical protein CALCODRAFT_289016 [Calocera cornea HHB12733]|uniref:Uncharacterized protein n=1 Tax=Calocera cornea HHB12733 TaxID=1353952 RepID=A0A165FVV3_9BASI|nr:hypothetical protein CALCODRAFT_289016 [Calocera cornea HHB12733]